MRRLLLLAMLVTACGLGLQFAPARPAAPRPASSPPPPAIPRMEWIAPGCPPQFVACLSGPASAALKDYLRASRLWMARCADAR